MESKRCLHCHGTEEGRKKERSDQEKRALLHRLCRMEGQIRGLKRMVEEQVYCPDILTQAAAVTSAMNAFSRTLLEAHLRSCVMEDLAQGKTEAVEELIALLRRMQR